MAVPLATFLLVFSSLCNSLVHAHGKSCSEQGLLQCDNPHQCYEPKYKCNGFWECEDHSDEKNCTVTYNTVSKSQNLAWLITPILLLLGAAYGIYKCVKDGVCSAIKHRIIHGRRERENRASDYHPLHQVSFYTSTQIPCTQLGINVTNLTPQQQMMLVHNQSFSIQFQGQDAENPAPQHVVGVAAPPSYDEATSSMPDGNGGTIVVMKNGQVIAIPAGGVLPPPYTGTSRRAGKRPVVTAAAHMEAIEEEEEVVEPEEEEDEIGDEETFFLLKETGGEGTRGRRRHHSQWSQKRCFSDRRRHHSCPS